jgi:transcription-repair coupling factor (superfamily II helicase)
VLLLAESDGRRESLLDFPARQRRQARRPSTRWPSSRPARESRHRHRRADHRLRWLEDGLDFVTETELFAAGPTTRRRKKQEQVSDVEALIKDLAELNVGDPVVHAPTASAATGA